MDENQLREAKTQPKSSNVPNLPNPLSFPNPIASTSLSKNTPDIDPFSLNLINFLTSMAQTVMKVCDPEYENVKPEEWLKICQEKCNRDISLIEGIRNPEKVCPRTKWDFSCSRPANTYDLSFMWYRVFVSVVDWANNIPEFRMLSDNDRAQLLRVNFTNLSFMAFTQCGGDADLSIFPLGNGSYIGNDHSG